MMFQRLLIDVTTIPRYMADFVEELARTYGVYIIPAERYVKLIQDEKTLDYLTKREQPIE